MDENFEALVLAINKKFPHMPMNEVFSLVRLKCNDAEFTPSNEKYLANAVYAHARHNYTNYEKFLRARKGGIAVPDWLDVTAKKMDRLVKTNVINDSQCNEVWRLVCQMLVSEHAAAVLQMWENNTYPAAFNEI